MIFFICRFKFKGSDDYLRAKVSFNLKFFISKENIAAALASVKYRDFYFSKAKIVVCWSRGELVRNHD